ncbi:MAG: RNA-binding transcriptional accessory protein [Oscillospiraceae bacterium]|nr:RNA-binding transcriptional accessory protein [Oscillospiraceae bacterium]
MDKITQALARELDRPAQYVQNVIDLMDEGNTIPFIARYRKEAHGAMDDTVLRRLEERLRYLRNLEQRRQEICRLIDAQGQLTEELAAAVENAETLSVLEDLYRPFRPKRRTRASMAKEKGLDGLAREILEGPDRDPRVLAEAYVSEEKGVADADEALAGASDVIAEMISDSPDSRRIMHALIKKTGILRAQAAKEEDSVYRQYYDFSQPVSRLQGHQVLAVNRGEKEGFLKVSLLLDRGLALRELSTGMIRPGARNAAFLSAAVADGYDRLLFPSVETETRAALTETAGEGAIRNFALNLKPLLMAPPVKGSVTMGLDPGYRMGCKVAVVDPTGKVLDTAVVYPTHGEKQKEACIRTLAGLIRKHGVKHIAIGNGTASRETEQMTAELLQQCPGVSYMVVSEAGASVYSASRLAAEEFPQYDVNLRSAVSIARRLQDPLAELVKIDPKAIGVGQYQHDMPQKKLEESLDAVVEDCVNAVGVDLNTASPSLLRRVSGLTAATAKNIAAYREENGAFTSRSQLLKVPKLGPKAYEQCAGFLRVPESRSVLDRTGVHPESYEAARRLLSLCGYSEQDVGAGRIGELPRRLKERGEEKTARDCGVGLPTLKDIAAELVKPGRDPRDELPPPVFRTDVLELKDLKPGMVLSGTVRNVIDFGAFVDIGVHEDGLVHISELCDRYVRHPSEVVSVGDVVKVAVLSVDEKRKRISLSMKQVRS